MKKVLQADTQTDTDRQTLRKADTQKGRHTDGKSEMYI